MNSSKRKRARRALVTRGEYVTKSGLRPMPAARVGLIQYSKTFAKDLAVAIIEDRRRDSHCRVVVGEGSAHHLNETVKDSPLRLLSKPKPSADFHHIAPTEKRPRIVPGVSSEAEARATQTI